jgi:hypothetical protein
MCARISSVYCMRPSQEEKSKCLFSILLSHRACRGATLLSHITPSLSRCNSPFTYHSEPVEVPLSLYISHRACRGATLLSYITPSLSRCHSPFIYHTEPVEAPLFRTFYPFPCFFKRSTSASSSLMYLSLYSSW